LKPSNLTRGGKSGLDYLRARQTASGAIDYSAASNQTPVWVTGDALIALAGQSLPVAAPPRQPIEPVPGGGSGGSSSGSGSGGSSSGGGTGGSASPAPSVPGVNGEGSSDGTGSGGVQPGDPVPLDPIAPDGVAPGEAEGSIFQTTPIAPTEALLAASESGPKPSPVLAVLIGLVTAAGLAGLTILLVRRKGW
jgi:hypothetical protein